MSRRFNVVLAFGTRPEAIKMAPVYTALRDLPGVEVKVLLSGQHSEQLAHALSLFQIPAAANLSVMRDRQALPELADRILAPAADALRGLETDLLLVHGDTLTTFTMSWAGFLERIPVAHVEAGLRTHDLTEPFPEEACRRLTDALAALCLAPTQLARENLLREGKDPQHVFVTGQTGVDAILYAATRSEPPPCLPSGRYVVVTLHRRENWPLLGSLAGALRRVAEQHPEFTFVYPVHLNPLVGEAVRPVLSGVPNVVLTEPLEYGPMAALLTRSELIVTDSGGLQEEGAALGVPVVVVRNRTERPEGLDAGILRLAGSDPERVAGEIASLLETPPPRQRTPGAANPYGDGRAGARVAAVVAWWFGFGPRPPDWDGSSQTQSSAETESLPLRGDSRKGGASATC